MTSTPTASSDRTRLCAPVMPVAGSAAAVGDGAGGGLDAGQRGGGSRVGSRAAPRAGVAACSLGVVVISAFSWALGCWAMRAARVGPTKNPSCHRHGGVSASVGDRRARRLRGCAGSRGSRQARAPAHCAPRRPGRQPARPTRWTRGVHFRRTRAGVEQRRVEGRPAPRRSSAERASAGRRASPAGSGTPCPAARPADPRSRRPRRRRPCPGCGPARRRPPPAPRAAAVPLDVGDELAVHLEDVDRQPGQVGQRGVARGRSRRGRCTQPISRERREVALQPVLGVEHAPTR